MALEYLKNFYQDNLFSKGILKIFDETISLENIKLPILVVATHTDHIAPWKSSFYGLNKTRGDKKFILAGSGHIAGIINPECSNKYGYWTNNENMIDIDKWFDAKYNNGSWWNEWANWILSFSGKEIDKNYFNFESFPDIENAPGSYVKKNFY